ncbi:hypothetical protein COY23_02660, partial [bacterium (Candidatus Torokbacteria) CG_4_10_14_0_2_um_filter_35_8]
MKTTIFKQTLKDTLDLLRKYKLVLIIITLIFVLGGVLGFFLPNSLKLIFLKSLSETLSKVASPNQFVMFFRIFLNNSFVGLLLILLG